MLATTSEQQYRMAIMRPAKQLQRSGPHHILLSGGPIQGTLDEFTPLGSYSIGIDGVGCLLRCQGAQVAFFDQLEQRDFVANISKQILRTTYHPMIKPVWSRGQSHDSQIRIDRE